MAYTIIEEEQTFAVRTYYFSIQENGRTVDRTETREEAENLMIEMVNSDNIIEAIEEALDELESRLCNDFGLNDIPDARNQIKDYVSFGY